MIFRKKKIVQSIKYFLKNAETHILKCKLGIQKQFIFILKKTSKIQNKCPSLSISKCTISYFFK